MYILERHLTKTIWHNSPGRKKANKVGFLSFTHWVFLTTYNFLAWLGMTIRVKKLEVSHNISDDS